MLFPSNKSKGLPCCLRGIVYPDRSVIMLDPRGYAHASQVTRNESSSSSSAQSAATAWQSEPSQGYYAPHCRPSQATTSLSPQTAPNLGCEGQRLENGYNTRTQQYGLAACSNYPPLDALDAARSGYQADGGNRVVDVTPSLYAASTLSGATSSAAVSSHSHSLSQPGYTVPQSSTDSGAVQCWQHGCDGRFFASVSNYRRHCKEKDGSSARASCPRCLQSFSRTAARDVHYTQGRCKTVAFDASGVPWRIPLL